MKPGLALRSVGAILLAMGVSLLVVGTLVSQGITKIIVPPPEMAAEQLVTALQARRYEGAMNQLSQDLRQQVSAEDLKALVDRLEQQHQGIEDAHGKSSQEQGDNATASVEIKWGDLQTQDVEFPLKKENQVWKVTSLGPLGE